MIQNAIQKIEAINFEEIFVYDDIDGRAYTYNEFFQQAEYIAKYVEKNIEGSNVIAIKENSYELALLYFAIMLTNKKIMVIDPQKGKEEIKGILGDIESSYVLADSGIDFLDETKHTLIDMTYSEKCLTEIHDIKNKILIKLQKRTVDMPYLVTFTSGTSGVTKGVEHTLDNLFLTAIALDKKVDKQGGTLIHVMPMTYMAGILNSLIYPFLVGTKIVIAKRFSIMEARNFWKKVIKYEVDLFWLSPSMLMMIDQMDKKHEGEEYCRQKKLTFLIGTAPLTQEMRNKFNERYGVKVYASYGLSETLFISVENDLSYQKSEINGVGEILDGVEYKFTDSDEMLIKVPWMYLGYTNEENAAYFEKDYYRTGDLAKIQSGCLYITGRSKDLIIKGGMNISPILIENMVYNDARILENVVIGVKDCQGEEKICCVYTLKQEVMINQDVEINIKKLVLENLGRNYMIDYLWNIKEIPRNINGKIDKNKLKQLWENKNE